MSVGSVEPGEREIGPVVAILIHDMFEDWLEGVGVSIDEFCTEGTGSWWFNYVEALRCVGARTVLICTSSRVEGPARFIHQPTGAIVWVLPSPRACKVIRWFSPQRSNPQSATNRVQGWLSRARGAAIRHIASYISTPISLLRSILKQECCKCIVVEEYEFPRFDLAVLLGWKMRLPVFGTFCGARPQGLWRRPLRPLALKLCAGLAICARREAERVMAHYDIHPDKVALIYYPLDFSVWHPGDKQEARALLGIPPNAQVVMYHGAIQLRTKGLDLLLDAFERVCHDRPDRDLRLILIGTGPDAQKLKRILAQKQVRGVEWLNEWVHDRDLIRRYLSSADVYVFPSRRDAFGIALIEAMACGLPVVAANSPGIPDILADGTTNGGIVVPPDNPLKLAEAILKILDDPSFARDLSERASRRARSLFSMERIGKQLGEFLLGKEHRLFLDRP